jgi:uncharacterized protein YvpB
VVGAVLLSGAGSGDSAGSSNTVKIPAQVLRLDLGGRTIAERPTNRLGSRRSQVVLASAVPASRNLKRGRSTIRLRTYRGALERSIHQVVATGGGTVNAPQGPVASKIRLPVIKQTLQDDCEATSISMMLKFAGKRVGQLTLQNQIARSGPLEDLSHGSPQEIYRRLLLGRTVMVCVALTEGPFASWHSPAGTMVSVNYGEHAVALTGVTPETVVVNDPLSGQRLSWSKSQFESMWGSLGRRALAS